MTATIKALPLARADYGLDAPGVVRTMALLAMTLLGTGLLLTAVGGPSWERLGGTLL